MRPDCQIHPNKRIVNKKVSKISISLRKALIALIGNKSPEKLVTEHSKPVRLRLSQKITLEIKDKATLGGEQS